MTARKNLVAIRKSRILRPTESKFANDPNEHSAKLGNIPGTESPGS